LAHTVATEIFTPSLHDALPICLFAVREDRVFVTGNVYTDEERLAEIIDDLVGTPVLLVDTQRIEREIEEIAWVDEALVRTAFPRSEEHTSELQSREKLVCRLRL